MLSLEARRSFQDSQEQWQLLAKHFSSHTPAHHDLDKIEQLLAQLLPARGQYLSAYEVAAALAPIISLGTADIDGNHQDEIFLATVEGDVQLVRPTVAGSESLRNATPLKGAQKHILGLTTYADPWGRQVVGVVTDEEDSSWAYNVQVSPDLSHLTLHRQPQPFNVHFAALAQRLNGAPSLTTIDAIRKQQENGYDGHVVRFLRGMDGQKTEWACAHSISALVYNERHVWIAGDRTRVRRLEIPSAADETLQPSAGWEGAVSGYITALLVYAPAAGTNVLLAACDDGTLHALDPETGRPQWHTTLPDIPLALALGDVDGDGEKELVIGYHNGRLAICTLMPQQEGTLVADRESETALNWAIAAAPDPAALAQRWHSANNASLAQAAVWLATEMDGAAPANREPSLPKFGELGTSWMEAQMGVRHRWHFQTAAALETMHAIHAPGTATTWLLATTGNGAVMLVDLNQQQIASQQDRGGDGIVRAASSYHTPSQPPELGLLAVDGTLRLYRLTAEVDIAAPQETYRVAANAWTFATGIHNDEEMVLFTGCDNGRVEQYTKVAHIEERRMVPTNYHSLRHLALLKNEAGHTQIAITDNLHLGFTILSLPDRRDSVHVALPQPVVGLLAWPGAGDVTYCVALCANEEVYVFNSLGEVTWRHYPTVSGLSFYPPPETERDHRPLWPAATLLDLDGDQQAELVIAVDDRVVVYKLDGSRLAELCLQMPIQHIQATHLETASGEVIPLLIAATPEGAIHIFEFLNQQQTERQKEEAALAAQWEPSGQDAIDFWAAQARRGESIYEATLALGRLGALALDHEEAVVQLATLPLSSSAPLSLRIRLLQVLINVLIKKNGSQESPLFAAVERVLTAGEDNPALWRAAVMALESAAGHELFARHLSLEWMAIFKILAKCSDEVTRRALACLASEFLAHHGTRNWWKILRLAIENGNGTAALALEAVALRIRNRFRQDQREGWRRLHQYLEYKISPAIIHPLTTSFLIQNEEERRLFTALFNFMGAGKKQKVETLQTVAAALKDAGPALQDEPLAIIYRDLAILASVDTKEALHRLFLEEAEWSHYFARYLEETPAKQSILRAFSKHLKESLLIIHQGLVECEANAVEVRLERLHHLATQLGLVSNNLSQEETRGRKTGHFATAVWLSTLATILDSWAGPGGVISNRIDRLGHEFNWDVRLIKSTLREDEIRIHFRLTNIGLATGFNLEVLPPTLLFDGHELSGIFDLDTPHSEFDLERNQELAGTLYFTLEPEGTAERNALMASLEKIELIFRIRYTQEGLQTGKKVRFFSLTTKHGLIDYKSEFPDAWKFYGARVRRQLKRNWLLFVELDRSARRSFFEACLQAVSPGQAHIVNLKRLFSRVRKERTILGERLPIRAQDLHYAMAQEIDEATGKRKFGSAYRSKFRHALGQGPRQIEILFFDAFDYLVIKLLEDEEGRKTLDEVLAYWRDLAAEEKTKLVFGGSYLTDKILQCLYPGFHGQMQIVRPNYLARAQVSPERLEQFLEKQLVERGLAHALSLFAAPLTISQLVYLCGGNLLFMREFALDGLEEAAAEAEMATGRARLKRLAAMTYFLEYGRRHNFFRMVWVWLPFYEKILLSLIASAEFAVEKKKWLNDLLGLPLSQNYRPGLPPGRRAGKRRSSKVEGHAGEPLSQILVGKIASSRYFSTDDVWIAGLTLQRPSFRRKEPAGTMFLRLLKATKLEALLARLEKKELILQRHTSNKELGILYTFRLPLWHRFFQHNETFPHMLRAAKGSDTAWYPSHLHYDANDPEKSVSLNWPKFSPVYRQIPLSDLPEIHQICTEEERNFFLNFYGIGSSRRRRWPAVVSLANALDAYRCLPAAPSEAEVQRVFAALNRLLGVEAAEPLAQLEERGPAWKAFGDSGVLWQDTMFDQVMPGLRKRLLVCVVGNGKGWEQNQIKKMRTWSRKYLRDAWRIEHERIGEEENGKFERQIVVVIVLSRMKAFMQKLKVEAFTDVHYVLLDEGDLGEIISGTSPAKKWIHLCQQRVKRSVLSPYKNQGPLEPGSHLFVGRQEELQKILQHVRDKPFIVLGSRRIGKTTLMRQVQYQLARDEHYLPLWVGITTSPGDFLQRVKTVLARTPYHENNDEAWTRPQAAFEELRHSLHRLSEHHGRFPVLLLDEIDELYRMDRKEGEPLFTFLRDLSQNTPPLCGLVMTGHREIYYRKHDHGSVFFNFGESLFLRDVEERELARLVQLLQEYNVKLYDPQEATALILEGTYYIPYLVQTVCDRLLDRLDRPEQYPRPDPDLIERQDIEIVLTSHIEQKLINDLIYKIRIEGEDEETADDMRLRIRIMVYAIVLEKYEHVLETDQPYRPLARQERYFTAQDVMDYLNIWAKPAKPFWQWSYNEIDELLQELRMTLVIATEGSKHEGRYYFPQDIIPRLLHKWYQAEQHGNPFDDLDRTLKEYAQLRKRR